MAPIALLSVSNKEGLLPLAKALLKDHGFQILSSGGTAKLLEEHGLQVTRVADFTNSPEILGGRVKTLHPKIHGGILAKRNDQSHKAELKEHNLSLIDLVVVNLYPFQKTIDDPNVQWDKAIENIDIGGPAMIRAAAKNHANVSVLTNPNQYESFLEVLSKDDKNLLEETRKRLAVEAFECTSSYDIAISKWMGREIPTTNSPWLKVLPHKQSLRYGENPHQKATWYSSPSKGWGNAKQLQGKELSTNNLLDLEAAIATIREFGYSNKISNTSNKPAAVVVKHTNPCGVAVHNNPAEALNKAINADQVSSFGGIIAVNSIIGVEAAKVLTNLFIECVVAPGFNEDAIKILSSKKNLRLLELTQKAIKAADRVNIRSILGGLLIQEIDDGESNPKDWNIPTECKPNKKEMADIEFSWKLVRHVRSNAIVVASNEQSLGIGAGQMNRIGAAKLALESAGGNAEGAVLASDGFFPFDDTVRLAAKHKIKSIVQPGGSIRDQDSINACNELGISMVITNKRHFLH